VQVKADGVLGLYKGVLSPLVGQMAFRASLFLSYGTTKELVGANPDDPLSYAKVRLLKTPSRRRLGGRNSLHLIEGLDPAPKTGPGMCCGGRQG
jgi:hypothetical protein